MGCRTNPRLAQSKPPLGKGFRSIDRERQSMGLHCLCAAPHQEIGLTAMQGPYDIIQLLRLRFRHLVGLFFNQVLPTGVGGDAIRAWRCRKLGIGLGPAIRSILLDRACGYLVLVVIYAASLPSLLHILPEARQ